eukprot:Mycagemm_TRINITY_DN10295_c2_g2::TRINITY_DN10295_c2_g2_i1::g.4087::m.4087 type:complete len:114 gc:universal TRINITY_DN10295_c2_g2_i1:401-742(+)
MASTVLWHCSAIWSTVMCSPTRVTGLPLPALVRPTPRSTTFGGLTRLDAPASAKTSWTVSLRSSRKKRSALSASAARTLSKASAQSRSPRSHPSSSSSGGQCASSLRPRATAP